MLDVNGVKVTFSHLEIGNGIYAITAPLGEQIYLLIGNEKALVIDNGMGIGSVKSYISQLTDLPLMAVVTHGHPDHAGGNGEFEEVWMHSADKNTFEEMCPVEYRIGDIRKIFAQIVPTLENHMIPHERKFRPIDNVESIDLGGRELEVLHIPGHTAGSICLFDRNSKTLFSGDMLNQQTWLYLEYSTPLEIYYESLIRIKEKDWQIKSIQTGHSAEAKSPELLEDMIECAKKIITGEEKGRPAYTFAGSGLEYQYKGNGILYNPIKIKKNK
jgi:Zn-dependent hydrolases, including glyoxylases